MQGGQANENRKTVLPNQGLKTSSDHEGLLHGQVSTKLLWRDESAEYTVAAKQESRDFGSLHVQVDQKPLQLITCVVTNRQHAATFGVVLDGNKGT